MSGVAILGEVRRLSRVWGVPLSNVDIVISSRFTTSAGSADARRNRVAISAAVPARFFRDVLRHELAHIATFRLVGNTERHHGATWQRLVRQAGGDPKANVSLPLNRRRSSSRYLHACPVCDFARFARRRVTAWRCADCVEAGLPGLLVITQVNP